MKRCPECRRDYYDDTQLYCLDDGNVLLEGPGDPEPATLIIGDGQGSPKPGKGAADREIDRFTPIANLPVEAPTEILRALGGKHNKNWNALWIGIGVFVVVGLIFAAWKFGSSTASKQSSPDLTDAASTRNAPNPAAYENYVRAKVLAASENRADIDTAIQLLEEVVFSLYNNNDYFED